MQFTTAPPPAPSLSRWWRLCRQFPGVSTIRKLEYELLERLDLSGRVLDVGGGEKSLYIKRLPQGIDYSSVNIDPDAEPTWLVEPGDPLPIEDAAFDKCLSLNTLEHVFDPQQILEEMHRVLRPGGVVYITVPWMFRIHGHPDDFHRVTPSWWRQALAEIGYSRATVTPLIWGRAAMGLNMTGGGKLRRHAAHAWDSIGASLYFRRGVYDGQRGERICNIAEGHFISAIK
ncbi:putative methyltransferase [Pseudobythopirellula maris]|uniref:Putative methyltransferase n=1 Tax=Pseudobythopirellula maris TaxID=2527991 RepID=A0A5C5ZJ98_9BACT|nr:class I SAM-dependent methyltransferase [Pseudobythopirellula maris]TWT86603.1 putative methyltransferase [Pseudobythopirellula maris]